MAPPKAKRQKTTNVTEQEAIQQAWEHYRNYLDSTDNDPQGDTDELHELVDILKPLVAASKESSSATFSPVFTSTTLPEFKSIVDMLPILLSVAYCHLAETAIGEYLQLESSSSLTGSTLEIQSRAQQVQSLLIQSLEYCHYNAATWSMGANFGRMSHRLPLAVTREWYERAVYYAGPLRMQALQLLQVEDEDEEEDEESSDANGSTLLKEWIELLILNQVVGVEYQVDEDENDDQEEENEDENDEEGIGYYSASEVEATARFMCAMLWSTQGSHDRALGHLQYLDGLTHRIHPNVWNVQKYQAQGIESDATPPSTPPLAFCPDSGILPDHLYHAMKKVFAPSASYWMESNYSGRGYFSFFMDHDKDQTKGPCNLIENVIVNYLLPRAKQVLSKDDAESICGFEWWAHTRPIEANLGHNLHFDTDESMLAQEGKVTHPILSSILYLTGGSDQEHPAGTTIILDQTPDSDQVASKCWQGTPKDNTFLLFPGNLLHGVLPCTGKDTSDVLTKEIAENESQLWNSWEEPPKQGGPDNSNRLTFMVGFWTRNVPEGMKERRIYGPCGPIPPADEEHTWVQQICEGYAKGEQQPLKEDDIPDVMEPSLLPVVSPAWESIQPIPREGTDEQPLQIPGALDHRFFVKGAPQCFRDSLFEDRDC